MFFFHNPKAAGTSIRTMALNGRVGQSVCPDIENDAAAHARNAGGYARFAGFDLYIGHYGRDIFDAVARDHSPITNFRNPARRIFSLYNYYRYVVVIPAAPAEAAKYGAVRGAKSLTFAEFALSDAPEIALHTCNHHFRQLTGSGWDPVERGTLEAALEFVDRMPWFYVCERAEASMRWAQAALGWTRGGLVRENVTARPGGGSCDELADAGLVARILSRNAKDAALWEHALGRLERLGPA